MRAVLLAALLAACTPGKQVNAPGHKKETEATLWNLCYGIAGDPIYYEDRSAKTACKTPETINWGQLPILVHISPEMPVTPMLWAFDVWEGWLGTEVFRLTPNSGDGIVEVMMNGDILDFGAAAFAPHYKDSKGKLHHYVIFWDPYQNDAEVIAHEFGHVLGLAHDKNDKRSIMYPRIGTVMPLLRAADREALCALYNC